MKLVRVKRGLGYALLIVTGVVLIATVASNWFAFTARGEVGSTRVSVALLHGEFKFIRNRNETPPADGWTLSSKTNRLPTSRSLLSLDALDPTTLLFQDIGVPAMTVSRSLVVFAPGFTAPGSQFARSGVIYLRVVIWPALVVMCLGNVATLMAMRKRRKPGCCGGCGYDLRGLALGGVCPECGKKPKRVVAEL